MTVRSSRAQFAASVRHDVTALLRCGLGLIRNRIQSADPHFVSGPRLDLEPDRR